MKSVYLVIDGEPMGKQRPRFSKFGTHTPEKTVNYETLVKQLFMVNKCEKLEGYIEANITAYFSIPKSTSNKKRQQMIDGTIRPGKADCDNVAKIILDALNKIAYDDDRQVVELNVKKYYSEKARVEICIREVEGNA